MTASRRPPANRPDTAHTLRIRAVQSHDIDAVATLVMSAFNRFMRQYYGPKGIDTFRRFTSRAALEARIARGATALVALDGETVTGYAEMRGNDHLTLLFSHPAHRREGVARALLDRLLVILNDRPEPPARITVNASTFARPAYEHLGFVKVGPAMDRDGIVSTPMALTLDGSDPE